MYIMRFITAAGAPELALFPFVAWAVVACGTAGEESDPTDSEAEYSDDELARGGGPTSLYALPFPCGEETRVTQGNDGQHSHSGVARYAFDLQAREPRSVVAMRAGTVTKVYDSTKEGDRCWNGGGSECKDSGNRVVVDHGDGTSSLYLHLSTVSVEVAQRVAQGEALGMSGGTGWSNAPHLHVQVQRSAPGSYWQQSTPLRFAEVRGGGVPRQGNDLVSGNCSSQPSKAEEPTVERPTSSGRIDVACTYGFYCGGNGNDGDPDLLYQCNREGTAVFPKRRCPNECVPQPAGVDDFCR